MPTYLTPHFTLEELTYSSTAKSKGISNLPDGKALENLKKLATLLESIRTLVGKPINISSGYRSPTLNKAVGGSSTSSHVKGLAADISVKGLSSVNLAYLIRDSGLKFDQLILEFPNTSSTWVHVGLSETNLRQQILTAKKINGKTQYLIGIQP